MADKNQPNQNAQKSKAEGERWSSDEDTVRNADRDEAPAQQYDEASGDAASGISNRPLTEEIQNQEDLPPRNTRK
jgi:hypothetical protein